MRNKILCGNTLEKLKELDSDSIDMVVTSPPYYFLRIYDGENVAWGGENDCKHEWVPKEKNINEITDIQNGKEEGKHSVKGEFCKLCGAWKGKLGNEPHPNMFIDNLVKIFQEVKRVLKPTGNFYLNMGETYFGGNMCIGQPDDWDSISAKNRDKKYYDGDDFNKLVKQRNSLHSNWLKPKQLMLIPARVAIAMQEDGWLLRQTIHWLKPNPMPSSCKDRRNTSTEYIFHFVKKPRYYYNLDAIRVPHRSSPIDRKEKTYAVLDDDGKTKNKIKKHINNVYQLAKKAERITYEGSKTVDADDKVNAKDLTSYLATARKVAREYIKDNKLVGAEKDAVLDYATTCSNPSGKNPGNVVRVEDCEYKGYAKSAHGNQDYHPSGKNPGNVLEVNIQPFKEAHFATFPEKLIEPLIKAGCPEDGVVLDIFAGSGTACLVAKQMGRDYLGIELSKEYCQMARKRLAKNVTIYDWEKEEGASVDELF